MELDASYSMETTSITDTEEEEEEEEEEEVN